MFSGLLRHTLSFVLVFTLWFSLAGQSAGNESDPVEAFNSGNYVTAINLWSQLYHEGNTDPFLLLNLGNAYAMLDSTAHAILLYEKALRFKPGSEEIQVAIKNERSRMPDAVAPLNQFFLIRWIKGFLVIFRPGVWAIIGLLLLFIALVKWFYSLDLIKRSVLLPQINTWIIVASGFIFLLIAFFSYRQIYRTDEAIIFSACESRQGPSVQSPLVRTLYPGEKVILTDTINDWYKVNLLNLDEAWIRKDCAEIIYLRSPRQLPK